jgi:hypothetical protein
MKPNAETHLTHAELLAAAVDPQDLGPERKTHLTTCVKCSDRHGLFLTRLENIGRRAEELAPRPSRPFRLPESRTPARSLGFKYFGVIGAALAVLLAVLVWQPRLGIDSDASLMTQAALARDRELMLSIDALVENALPASYQALAFVNAPFGNLDNTAGEDFLEWLVPDIDLGETNESLT